MASSSRKPPKTSKRDTIRDAFKSGLGQVKSAVKISSSASPTQDPGASLQPLDLPQADPNNPDLVHTTSILPGPSAIPSASVVPVTTETHTPLALADASASSENVENTENNVWIGLKAAMYTLEQGATVFPPLKAAIEGLSSCVDAAQLAEKHRIEYSKLADDLKEMAKTINEYMAELQSESGSGNVARISRLINDETAIINHKTNRGKWKRLATAEVDQTDIIEHYRRIDGLFRQLQTEVTLRSWVIMDLQHKMLLLGRLSPADDARYNSSYSTRVKRRGCTAETREQVQADLQDWIRSPKGAKVYWMNGMAGTGKTTIAYSVCEYLEANQLLAASFFCSRASSSCSSLDRIVPTIAYQFARYSPAFCSRLCKALESDPDASTLDVTSQFRKLIQEPLAEANDAIKNDIVVVIDAVEECIHMDSRGVRLILELLLRHAVDMPLKFLITSRPEPMIQDEMQTSNKHMPSILYLHNIELSVVEGDIKKYLKEALVSIPIPPSDNQIERLAKRAGKLFIYAATVVRYVLPDRGISDPVARLDAILAATRTNQSGTKYKQLDNLYQTILMTAFGSDELELEERDTMLLVLGSVVCAKEPIATGAVSVLLQLTERQVSSALRPLQSVLHLSDDNLVSILHTSFAEYVLDQSRSGQFHCNEVQISGLLARRCFEIMEQRLQFNICDLKSSFLSDPDAPNLTDTFVQRIHPPLFYACRYWGDHICCSAPSESLCKGLVDFLSYRLLFWIEVLNLGRCISAGISALARASDWLLENQVQDDTQVRVADARKFLMMFAASACSLSTCHLYISALEFCPRKNSVYVRYWNPSRRAISMGGTIIEAREYAALATWKTESPVHTVATSPNGDRVAIGAIDGTIHIRVVNTGAIVVNFSRGHTGSVLSIAFSSDGSRLVSGSHDQTLRIWDVKTGEAVGSPLDGHTDSVYSVAFSPDSKFVVSGSSDKAIRVWDARTGDCVISLLEAHEASVNSVAYSPDGNCIVSGSDDTVIRLWEIQRGNLTAGPCKEHMASIRSVAFSPEGNRIASGLDNGTVRLWDPRTGDDAANPFEGHSNSVCSVSFSPNGSRIVSGSEDGTIMLWDASTGDLAAGPLQGHRGSIHSVAYTPDGAYIISGSNDKTVRIWDASIKKPNVGPFRGHSGPINSVAFSPDGGLIASGAGDGTIRVWHTHTGEAIAGPFGGHSGEIFSVAFSPNGAHIVSGSSDTTVRVWRTHTGDPSFDALQGHNDSVYSVAFSPNGSSIISGSHDATIRLWNAHTGAPIADPFEDRAGPVNAVGFSPDSTLIVSAHDDGIVLVRDIQKGDIVNSFLGSGTSAMSAAFSPDGRHVLSGSYPHTIELWDIHTGGRIFSILYAHTDLVNSVSFAPDGTRVVTGSADSTIQVWDASTGSPCFVSPFRGHEGPVHSVAFSPDGCHIVSASDDGTIRVWDAPIDDRATNPSPNPTCSAQSLGDPSQQVPSTEPTTNNNDIEPPTISNSEWELREDGWMVSEKKKLLFWVPSDLHYCLPWPPARLTITPQGSVSTSYSSGLLGERWSEFYHPNS